MSIQNKEAVLSIIDKLAEYCLYKSFSSGASVRDTVVELGKTLRENEPIEVVKAAYNKVVGVKHVEVWLDDPERKGHGKYENDTTLQGYFKEITDWGEAEGLESKPNKPTLPLLGWDQQCYNL